MEKKIVAIGDIHGCVRSLKTLWTRLKPYKDAIHVFVGDYIDRGPSSKEVIDFLLDVRYDRECIFLRGNHEQMLLDAMVNVNFDNWIYNGGGSTLKSYNNISRPQDLPDEHIDFYLETMLYYDTKDYFFVHAGIPPHLTIEQCKDNPDAEHFFLWGREHLNALSVPWEKTVVFGHTPRPYPIRKNKMIGIDTGCVYTELGYGKLTAVLLPEQQFIEQVSLD
jgi:serine/threonine protein phosphatase 1